MKKSLQKMREGYQRFRDKYVHGDSSILSALSEHGQRPEVMILACCDSRVDPALLLQCDPGDLFVVRNVANIVPVYDKKVKFQGTSAALEFGIRFLQVKHLIVLGHSQCGGVASLLNGSVSDTDFLKNWVALIKNDAVTDSVDAAAHAALKNSYNHCLTFPWIAERVNEGALQISLWFFDISRGCLECYDRKTDTFYPL